MGRLRDILASEGLVKEAATLEPAAVALREQIKKLLRSKATEVKNSDYRNRPGVAFSLGMNDDPKVATLDFLTTLHKAFPDMDLRRPRKNSYGAYQGKLTKADRGETKFVVTGHPSYPGGKYDDDTPVKVWIEIWVPKAPKPAPKAIAPADPLTKRQWSAILNAMRRGYDNSYAMMVDDSFGPFERAAPKYGLGAYYDGEVFSFLHWKVRNHDGKLSGQDVIELNEMKARDAF
jgi:hypothetical protein